METQANKLKTAAEVADILQIAKSAVYRYTRNGEFRDFAVAVGNKYRYRPDGLERYLDGGAIKADAANDSEK
jgi:excisionase family DNA binding protein